MISLASSDIPLQAWLNLSRCLFTKRIGRGYFVSKFEEKIADYFGVKHAIATCNGTLADTVMLMTLKNMCGGEEVVIPAFSFVAQANSVLLAGLKPVFCDVNEDMSMNSNILPKLTEKNHLCTFPAHMLGKDCTIRFNGSPILHIKLIEDCCEAMGGEISYGCNNDKKLLGTLGVAGSFSMFPSHTITTGEGGVIITNDDQFALIARSIINHGKWESEDFTFKFAAVNAKMSDLQAAVGCSLVERIDRVNKKRRENVMLYNKFLGLSFSATAPHCYPVFYDTMNARDLALQVLRSKGIQCRKLMGCIPDYPFYKKYVGHEHLEFQDFPVARKLAETGLYVPVHQNLTASDIERVCEVIYETR